MKARGKEESSLFTGYARLSIGSQTGVTLNFSKAQPLDQNPVTVSTAMSGASTGGNAPVASQKADDQYSTPIPSQSKGDGDIHKCPPGCHGGDCRQSALPSRSPEASASIRVSGTSSAGCRAGTCRSRRAIPERLPMFG